MKCPVCESIHLKQEALLPGLAGFACGGCAGVWVDRERYEMWRSGKSTAVLAAGAEVKGIDAAALDVEDVSKAKLCPQCGHLLFPYRVGRGVDFRIDYCGACGGVWCDHNEWLALCEKGLHNKLHDIVSERWQLDLRCADLQRVREAAYEKRLGGAYPKSVEVREWLVGQKDKDLILAYLQSAVRP